MFNHLGEVKRADLELRTEYLGLDTKIYLLEKNRYLIFCENYKGDIEKLKEHFDYTIRPLCCPVQLVDRKPKEFREVIENISFDNIISDFQGLCLTQAQINNMITSKFHYIGFIDIVSIPGANAELIITISDNTKTEDIDYLEKFISEMELSFKRVIIRKESDKYIKSVDSKENGKNGEHLYNKDPLYCFTDKKFPFSVNDADYWFSNVEEIYQGKIGRKQLPFFNPGETKCYLDFSQFKNINLRNNILLYDKIYLALPMIDRLESFFKEQKITRNELIQLVEMDKIVFLLPNTELNYDKDLIMEAYKQNNNSVISKRGINALIACYITEVEKVYFGTHPEYKKLVMELYSHLIHMKDRNAIQLAKIISWPIRAKIQSFKILNQSSPIGISNFGVNKTIEDEVKSIEETNELSFEFMVNSSNIHISTALQATYFPFSEKINGKGYSDSGVSVILGNLLNAYYYSSMKEINQIEKVMELNERENNYINFLNTDNTISITKFAERAEKYNTQVGLVNILDKLEHMDEKERKEKISDYNTLLCDIGEIPDKERFMCLKYFLGGASILSKKFSSAFTLADMVLSVIDRSLSNKKILELKQIEYKMNKIRKEKPEKEMMEDVYILDKISRIAKLR